eukprot:CAMPEP_0114525360 /NCGR_PEP_ID=MMETSP0109-20121206/22375_1 /TAXON_ID=29199 /ORGANISM="Chlorarachnion reptans, Strain CCCM449" /LENGTH=492 /DNA_ID=CAMNT_0001706921 /DNA_START=304 /DNA_END=1782 /DNA_ORIENTATION=+
MEEEHKDTRAEAEAGEPENNGCLKDRTKTITRRRSAKTPLPTILPRSQHPALLAVLLVHLPLTVALRNGLDLVPPMGWSNWESTGCSVSEDLIKEAAAAMIDKGLVDAGYRIVGIDDCWAEKERNATGHLVPSKANFSSGMRSLGDYLHSKGLQFGIYSSAGAYCCQATMPGSLGYEWIDAQTFADWGVDFLKYDGCFGEQFADVLKDSPRRFPFNPPPILKYPLMAEALNRTGRNISYLCNFPWTFWDLYKDDADGGEWVGEFCNSWRTGGDAQPGFANALSYVTGSEEYASAVPSGPGRWNHLDSLEIGNNRSFDVVEDDDGDGDEIGRESRWRLRDGGGGMNEGQEQAIFSLFALVKSPLMIGADVRTLAGHSLETYLNKEVIAINQDPLGKRGRRVRQDGDVQVWVVELANGDTAAVLLNGGSEQTVDIQLSWTEAGIEPPKTPMVVRDLWQHKDIGTFEGSFTAKDVDPESAVVLRLRRDKLMPTFV